MSLRSGYDSFDRLQQRNHVLGFVLAVRQKYRPTHDRGGDMDAHLRAVRSHDLRVDKVNRSDGGYAGPVRGARPCRGS